MKRIVAIGPESTGKTSIARGLASHFQCPLVEEYARIYIDNLDRPYHEGDLIEIAKGQLRLEDSAGSRRFSRIICDTDLRVIKIWSLWKYGRLDPWIAQQIQLRSYDLYLLMNIDLPWQTDPQRESRLHRPDLFQEYLREVQSSGIPYVIISGIGDKRLQNAVDAVKRLA